MLCFLWCCGRVHQSFTVRFTWHVVWLLLIGETGSYCCECWGCCWRSGNSCHCFEVLQVWSWSGGSFCRRSNHELDNCGRRCKPRAGSVQVQLHGCKSEVPGVVATKAPLNTAGRFMLWYYVIYSHKVETTLKTCDHTLWNCCTDFVSAKKQSGWVSRYCYRVWSTKVSKIKQFVGACIYSGAAVGPLKWVVDGKIAVEKLLLLHQLSCCTQSLCLPFVIFFDCRIIAGWLLLVTWIWIIPHRVCLWWCSMNLRGDLCWDFWSDW